MMPSNDKRPSDELLEHLQAHRQKSLQPPPEPREDAEAEWAEEPTEDGTEA